MDRNKVLIPDEIYQSPSFHHLVAARCPSSRDRLTSLVKIDTVKDALHEKQIPSFNMHDQRSLRSKCAHV